MDKATVSNAAGTALPGRQSTGDVVASQPRPEVPLVEILGLSKRFEIRRGWGQLLRHPGRRSRRVVAVERISFQVERGELFGLLGPNGAGKTTLLKMLSTLVEPDEGTARICGSDLVAEPAAIRALVAPVISDERSLNWRLSAVENLRFYGALYGQGGSKLSSRVEELLVLVGLEEAGAKIIGAFSSGMRQRLMIARALLARPKVLLLDEPTRSLDPVAARDFRTFLRTEIAESQGCTILLATHDPEEGLELCDRVAVLHRGHVVASGAPKDLLRRIEDRRYRVWTPDPSHPLLARIASPLTSKNTNGKREDSWHVVDVEVHGGDSAAAGVLKLLIDEGVRVARFEKLRPTLADLIESLLHAEKDDAHVS